MTRRSDGPLLRVLDGEAVWPPPAWLMRQAGRYLPEYRAVRADAGGFLDLCYSPKLATEVTLQPIRRFGFDAAILFSDILVVPDALGQAVRFEPGEGPKLDALSGAADIARLRVDRVPRHLAPVIETVADIRAKLDPSTALLGFCGAPWTVATYMIAGGKSDDHAEAKRWAYDPSGLLDALVDVLTEASIVYLAAQLQAGADAVQIFDTWAGSLDASGFERFVTRPTARIVAGVRAIVPQARIIGFPRGAGARLVDYVVMTGVDAVSLDWATDAAWAAHTIGVPIQGNLDPLHLTGSRDEVDGAVARLFAACRGRPYIFNLGHGITPDTPIEAVERLMVRVRQG